MKQLVTDPRRKRKIRIRKKIQGRAERPRMSVFRSGRHIYAQIIDDTAGRVLVSASSLSKAFKESQSRGSGVEVAKMVGAMIAERALEGNITQVVFDRNGYLFHGRIKALADAAREKGLQF